MILLVGSIVLATVQVTSTGFLVRKHRAGWLLSIAANVIGAGYDALTGQYGFLPICVINLTMAVKAYTSWGRHDIDPE